MKTPYVPHFFGDVVEQKLRSHIGWLTAGVASSIPWPKRDVWVQYGGDDYFLRGTDRNGNPSPPCITVACASGQVDSCMAKVYRFTSILGWFKRGFVDVVGYVSGSSPLLYDYPRRVYTTVGAGGLKSFSCNHMPLVEDDSIRKALAFWREGQSLRGVHDSYSFLSFYKVIESQFAKPTEKRNWITANIDQLGERAAARVAELRGLGFDVSQHLWESGRCAVAHASLEGEIVDPDIPGDRRRLTADLEVMRGLAKRFVRDELHVPDELALETGRDRLSPWDSMLPPTTLDELRKGGTPHQIAGLDGRVVAVGLWPDGPVPGLERMTLRIDSVHEGVVKVVLINERSTLFLVFFLDYRHGRVHTNLDDGGVFDGDNEADEVDALAWATFYFNVLGNRIAELSCAGFEPIDCVVVIPVNIIPPDPATAIPEAMERFRRGQGEDASQPSSGA